MREITAFPTAITDRFHQRDPPRHTLLPVVADSADDAVHLIAACFLAACHDTRSLPFHLEASARDSLTATIDPDDNGRLLAVQDTQSGFLWFDGYGTVYTAKPNNRKT